MDKTNEMRQLMKAKGFTLNTLAQRTGLDRQTIARYMNHPKPSKKQRDSFVKLARALGTTEAEIRRMTGHELQKQHPILDVLNERQMTMLEFSEESGVPYETLRGIITGKVKKPRPETISYIADMLEVDEGRLT